MLYDDRPRDRTDYNNMLQGLYPFRNNEFTKISKMIYQCSTPDEVRSYIKEHDLFNLVLDVHKECPTFRSVFAEWVRSLK